MNILNALKNLVIGRAKNFSDRHIFHKASLIAMFAWVGLGAIASHHVAALAELSALAEPVAGCDPSAAARVRFADRLTAYESLEEMLDAASVDVVVVSTPTPTHHEVCRRVLRHGGTRTVLVEKPIATTVEEVAELLDAAQAAGIDLRIAGTDAHRGF